MPKQVVDLTAGGICDACDAEKACAVCKVPMSEEVQLYYAPSGDHDHLVMRNGRLGREAHGQFMCAPHYKVDFEKTYPGEIWSIEPVTKTLPA